MTLSEVLFNIHNLKKNKNLTNPKYVVHFNFDSRILWKNSENDELSKFGLLYG